MIAFTLFRFVGDDIFEDLWVMQSNGRGRRRLAANATSPTWSPTGGRLAYVNVAPLDNVHIRVINVDGTEGRQLTPPGLAAFQPAWSPMDARIAFVTLGDKELHLVDPDGTDLVNLTQGQADDDGPAWSPDGTKIVFTTSAPGDNTGSEIAVVNQDGSGRTILTNRPDFDVGPAWSPDGQMIVFYGTEAGNSEVFVISADGSALRNVTNRPATDDSQPNWAGGGIGASLRGSAGVQHTIKRRQ
jgi:TolB protein